MNDSFTCRIVRGDQVVFESEKSGISPLIAVIDGGVDARGCTAYDKIVGKAAALLYVLMGVEAVHAGVLGAAAKSVLENSGIAVTCDTLTERIINRKGDGLCPMELTVQNIDEPKDAFDAIKQKLIELKNSH